MKVLLDECVHHQLRSRLTGHDAYTATFVGLTNIKNGELLRRAAAGGFEVLITVDRGMRHQHNADTLPIAVMTLNPATDRLPALLDLVPAILSALDELVPRTFVDVP